MSVNVTKRQFHSNKKGKQAHSNNCWGRRDWCGHINTCVRRLSSFIVLNCWPKLSLPSNRSPNLLINRSFQSFPPVKSSSVIYFEISRAFLSKHRLLSGWDAGFSNAAMLYLLSLFFNRKYDINVQLVIYVRLFDVHVTRISHWRSTNACCEWRRSRELFHALCWRFFFLVHRLFNNGYDVKVDALDWSYFNGSKLGWIYGYNISYVIS